QPAGATGLLPLLRPGRHAADRVGAGGRGERSGAGTCRIRQRERRPGSVPGTPVRSVVSPRHAMYGRRRLPRGDTPAAMTPVTLIAGGDYSNEAFLDMPSACPHPGMSRRVNAPEEARKGVPKAARGHRRSATVRSLGLLFVCGRPPGTRPAPAPAAPT